MEDTHPDTPQFPRPQPSRRRIPIRARLIPAAIALCVILPANASLWWHIRHGNQIVWQDTRFHIPYAWSAAEMHVYTPGSAILYRHPWLPFAPTSYANSLYLDPPASLNWRDRVFANWRHSMEIMPWGTISEFSRTISTRVFHCISQPVPMHAFLYGHVDDVHAYCQEQASGWQLSYWGSPKYLDESLVFLGKGETIPPTRAQQNPATVQAPGNSAPAVP